VSSSDYDWRNKKIWKYKGGKNPTSDPNYIRDRKKLFKEHGNGWWWNWHLVPPSKRPIDLWNGRTFEPNMSGKKKRNA
tara:strand:- start:245 stop:478 length:234 start_codon:yes stop_codon:yes gene_type:complete